MMSGRHPLIGPIDFALVEDTNAGKIVASTCLLSQVWRYADLRIPIGRPEIVATDPDYRRRGLIRAIFELIHARSEACGDLAQEITGISNYYRQFGYEYALDLGGSRDVSLSDIPVLKEGEVERFTLRPATLADTPTLMRYEQAETAPYLLSTAIDETYWRWVLDPERGIAQDDAEAWRTYLIEAPVDDGNDANATNDASGERRVVGHVYMARERWGKGIPVWGCYMQPGVSLVAAVPSLLREIARVAANLPARAEAPAQPAWISFILPATHPFCVALGTLVGKVDPPYATYVRVADLPAFIRHIAPVLERRLAESLMANHSGETKLDFYRGGLRLVFARGRLVTAEDWQIPLWGTPQAGFPSLVFLQLLLGYRSLAELRYAFPDVWTNDETTTLLNILFPKLPSAVGPIG
ncbi:MAG: GNAT family N-acetyltransferase, partial [Ktedonobacterales bacterium]